MGVTLRDIARQLNVSVTTVSNVLRGTGRVSDETRRAVLDLAEKTGYLKQRQSTPHKLLGLIFCAPPEGEREPVTQSTLPEVASHYTSEAVEGIDQVIAAHGYHLLFRIARETDSEADMPEMVEQRAVQGLFVVGGSISDAYVKALRDFAIPMVVLFTYVEQVNVNCVLADNTGGAYLAVNHLVSLGHKRIGFINGWDATRTSLGKLAGYRRVLTDAGLETDPELVVTGDFTYESGYARGKELLELPSRPSALFVADDTMALGAMKAARDLGLSVPADVAVVGFGDGPFSRHAEPPLTTVQVPKRNIGELAARRLMELLEEKSSGPPLQIVVATELVVRESCGASLVKSGVE